MQAGLKKKQLFIRQSYKLITPELAKRIPDIRSTTAEGWSQNRLFFAEKIRNDSICFSQNIIAVSDTGNNDEPALDVMLFQKFIKTPWKRDINDNIFITVDDEDFHIFVAFNFGTGRTILTFSGRDLTQFGAVFPRFIKKQ